MKPGKKYWVHCRRKSVKHPQAREPVPHFLPTVCDGFHSAFPGRGWIREARSGDRKFLEKLESVLKENSDGSIGLLVNSGAKGGMDDLRAMGAYLGDQELFRDDERDTPAPMEGTLSTRTSGKVWMKGSFSPTAIRAGIPWPRKSWRLPKRDIFHASWPRGCSRQG
jgi:hypothetical protein